LVFVGRAPYLASFLLFPDPDKDSVRWRCWIDEAGLHGPGFRVYIDPVVYAID
jgi:hypothetical protein